MEYRLWITVPDLPLEAEATWTPFIKHLEQAHADMGPILSWDGEDAVVVMSTEAVDDVAAGRRGLSAVTEALETAKIDRHISSLRFDHAESREPVHA